MSYEYSENKLVQESAANLLQDQLGWEVQWAFNDEILGVNGTFGRTSYKEVLLLRYFRAALKQFNSWITESQINEAIEKFQSHSSAASLLEINEEKYFFIRDGIPVTVKLNDGKTETKRATIIDFDNPENNHFLAIKELKIHGAVYKRRTDIVGFINGVPLLFIELKKLSVDVQNAYTDNYTDYQHSIPQLFYYNAFVMLSNSKEAKIGTLGSKYAFFHEWKRLREDDRGRVDLETMLKGVCKKENFLDLLENFILFDHSGGKTVKILARNHQYLGVNEAVKAYTQRKARKGRLGVFWHTQGSGKSYSMIFLSQKIRRKFSGSPTIVILTDRDELNKQICETFLGCGLMGKAKGSQFIATSGKDLIHKLNGNPSFIFTLIQKFNLPNEKPIYPDHDIIIMSDEAHRSQYGVFAANLEKLLPTASRIGFTGTPLLKGDLTAVTFGEYLSIYDFNRAVEDGATVPLYYENRGEKIRDIFSPVINDQIIEAIENADLDQDQTDKLEAQIAKAIHLLQAEPRLRSIAKDFVHHYTDEEIWTSGKAMFVCLNKVTCVRMYNYVQEYWKEEIGALKKKIKQSKDQQAAQELERKLVWMEETEMAVVISQEQNEEQTFQKWGLDIIPHRLKMDRRELDKEFKDENNPFRIVFVCAMWLTGFDVKCLSCLYLDKLLRAHNLMQTIARANRVAEGKTNGLIIDYIGIVKALRKALADYTVNRAQTGGVDPTIDKSELIGHFIDCIENAKGVLASHGFELQLLISADGFQKTGLVEEGEDAVCRTLEERKMFCAIVKEAKRLKKYLNKDDINTERRREYDAVCEIYAQLQKKKKHADNTELMVQINAILNNYVSVIGTDKRDNSEKRFNISSIDFDHLHEEFKQAKTRHLILKDLGDIIEQKLESMVMLNHSRVNFLERYQKIIDDYNNEQDSAMIEKTFIELMRVAGELDEEQQRYVREGFSNDEELSIFDLLLKEDLNRQEIKKIKEVAVDILQQVNAMLAKTDHWRDKQETRESLRNLIRDTLWKNLPTVYEEINITECRDKLFDYFYERQDGAA